VIAAVGQTLDLPDDGNGSLKLTRRGTVAVDSNSLRTSIPGVFAAGDAVSGPSTLIEAIAQGERAAIAIDRHLKGEPLDRTILIGYAPPNPAEVAGADDQGDVKEMPRAAMPCRPAKERSADFREVELGFDEACAMAEASRCLHCHRSS